MTPTPCRPRRSWQARRRIAVVVATAVSAAILLVALIGPWRREVFAPGALSQPHAQILGGQLRNERCAACHSVARGGLSAWFGSGGEGHRGVSQSQLCIECHHTTITPDRALAAHNLKPEELRLVSLAMASGAGLSPASSGRREVTWHDSMPRPPFANDDVQCAVCHREHGGKNADLTWMSSTQCQSCHQDRFASFAHGHPEWGSWPYGRGGQIAFNHTTHAGDHFAKEGKAFDCQSCHTVSTAGEIARSGSFESACASCHDQPLRSQASLGIDLVALPMLNVDAAEQAGIAVGGWPDAASGVDEITLPPLTRLLLESDPAVAEAIDQLTDPTANLWTGPPSQARLEATAQLAAALRTLLDALARDARGEVERRLGTAAAANFVGQLSPQTIAVARDRWFKAPSEGRSAPDETAAPTAVPPRRGSNPSESLLLPQDDNPLRGDPLGGDPPADDPLLSDPLLSDPLLSDSLSEDPLSQPQPLAAESNSDGTADDERFDAARALPAGGWYRDELRQAVRYRGAGHADPVLRAVLEFASQESLAPADRASLLRLPAVAACAKCHPAVRSGEPSSWRSIRSDADRRTFTRFSHRPHLNLPELADCTHCHASPAASVRTVSTGTTASEMPADFAPLERTSCVSCHTPKAAGDNCTKCHRYHVEPPL